MSKSVKAFAALGLIFSGWSAAAQPSGSTLSDIRSVPVRTTPASERGRAIPGRFVVTLQPRADPRVVAREHGLEPDFIYNRVITGFAGSMSDLARSGLLRDNRVVRVEPDRPARVKAVQSWGLDRIDQRALPLDDRFAVDGTGRGVTVYVVDTGISFDHTEFGGRAVPGYDSISDGRNGLDCNGHGTHVAGTVGGRTVGVAPESSLVAVRVLDCEGTGAMSGVIAGLDWIAQNGRRPGVVNMSLGGDPHTTTDDAVRRLISLGYGVVVAAGNESADACGSSPARVTEAVTVAASGKSDARPSWSNYGSCVDLFAPGEAIISAWHTSQTAGAAASGTSMAAPHVAGAGALLLQANSGLSPQTVRDSLYQSATKKVVTNAASANNHLLFVGSTSAESPQETISPTSGVTINGTSGDDVVNPSRTVAGQPLPTTYGDLIYGQSGNDTLDGGAGADTMTGGPGNDRIYRDNSSDSVVESPSEGTDTVYSSVSYGLGANLEHLTLTGTASINGYGNALNNTINGNAANNILDGGVGADTLRGGAGNDIYYRDDASDAVVEASGDGTDIVHSSVSYGLGANLETLILTGMSAINGHGNVLANSMTGNAAANVLNGNDGNDVLRGAAGNDSLNGGNGADSLYGGAGNDAMSGGSGADRFFFDTPLSASGNIDTISDIMVADETIFLNRSVFGAITADGTLAAGAFHTGTAAQDAGDRIIYDSAIGNLYYDPDGNGGAAAVPFARLPAGLPLTNADFIAYTGPTAA